MIQKDPSQPNRLTPPAEINAQLASEGYTEIFVYTNEGLKSTSNQEVFKAADLKIVKHYRYEGTTDPADMTIIYAIQTNTGLKGTVVTGYGPNSEPGIAEFFTYVEELPNENNPNGYKYNGGLNQTYH